MQGVLACFSRRAPRRNDDRVLRLCAKEQAERRISPFSGRIAVSPGLTSRPSLSEPADGVSQPRRGGVSPGLTSRPSLSEPRGRKLRLRPAGVAGFNLPAFVERTRRVRCWWTTTTVSPGLTSRPSLSAPFPGAIAKRRLVSPGLTSRPSLSGSRNQSMNANPTRVAGFNLPAFVERGEGSRRMAHRRRVSPGLTSRPSLSDVRGHPRDRGQKRVSPGLTSRPSLSVALGFFHAVRRMVSPGLTSRPSLSGFGAPVDALRRRQCRRV